MSNSDWVRHFFESAFNSEDIKRIFEQMAKDTRKRTPYFSHGEWPASPPDWASMEDASRKRIEEECVRVCDFVFGTDEAYIDAKVHGYAVSGETQVLGNGKIRDWYWPIGPDGTKLGHAEYQTAIEAMQVAIMLSEEAR